jgi:hypothetical protein
MRGMVEMWAVDIRRKKTLLQLVIAVSRLKVFFEVGVGIGYLDAVEYICSNLISPFEAVIREAHLGGRAEQSTEAVCNA